VRTPPRTLADGQPRSAIDRIYDETSLFRAQQEYHPGFLRHLDTRLRPLLTQAELSALADVSVVMPPSRPGQEPLGYCAEHGRINVSAASAKLFDEIVLARAWLLNNGYVPDTLNEYLLLLHTRGTDPELVIPSPLVALGIPHEVRHDERIDAHAKDQLTTCMHYILLHECAHIIFGHLDGPELTPEKLIQQEVDADGFAMEVMARGRNAPLGLYEFFEIMNMLMPSPVEFQDREAYEHFLEGREHPLPPERMTAFAQGLRDHEERFVRQFPGGIEQLRELARLIDRMAALFVDKEYRDFLWGIGATVQLEGLGARRPHQTLAAPPGAVEPAHDLTFAGLFEGEIVGAGEPTPLGVWLARDVSTVQGIYRFGLQMGQLQGTVRGDELLLTWRQGHSAGHGRLSYGTERTYGGTWSLDGSTDNGGRWTIARVAIEAMG